MNKLSFSQVEANFDEVDKNRLNVQTIGKPAQFLNLPAATIFDKQLAEDDVEVEFIKKTLGWM